MTPPPTPGAPEIDCETHHASIAVPDVQAAIDFYVSKLGFSQSFVDGDAPTFAGITIGRVQIFIEKGAPNPHGSSIYFVVGNADELLAWQREQGVEVDVEIGDRDYGLRDYSVRDLHGNRLTFGQHLFNAGEPIHIERVAVPLRLEKRLAGLLYDLADYKRMSLSSCVEEILLHTNEPLGDGVASPHTRGQLAHIQRLKLKHGIDYDSHGSYRFVE
jgi:catechol 2,3-dioxygenase-like lactoylglutathione lyase family enzyme